jgi:hypothetical protein
MSKLLAAVAVVVALSSAVPLVSAQTAPPACTFVLGFQTLHDLDPQDIGDCIDNQTFAANGDAQQHTTKGLMAWRKADNWTAFTNGYMTWINGPTGLVSRLNTDRFPWEHDQAAPAAPSRVGLAAAYPNPAITPGLADPRVTQDDIQQTICVSGYTSAVRPPTSFTGPLKIQQIAQYGYADTNAANYEEDHLVPLELGGAPADAKNLWPEPCRPTPGAHEKDRVENYLHDQVCSGAMGLVAAQQAIEDDWVVVYQQITGPSQSNPPSPSSTGGHTFYASTYGTAHTIYCDTDPGWKSLSPKYLVSYSSLDVATAALPGYTLRQAC